MNIGILTTGFPRYEGDLAGTFVLEMNEALRALGVEVKTFAPASSRVDRAWDHEQQVTRVRYKVPATEELFYEGGAPLNLKRWQTWPGAFTFPAALLRAVRESSTRWDAIIAHFGFPCGAIAQGLHPRSLSIWHSADTSLAAKFPSPFRTALLRGGSHWFVAREGMSRLGATPTERIRVQHLGARIESLPDRVLAQAQWETKGQPVALFVGRHVPIKGGTLLMRAARRFRGLVLVAGAGPETARWRAMAPSNVRFVGSVYGEEKASLFAAADFLVVPSLSFDGRSEGAPTVIGEARLAGLPVLVTDSGGQRDLVRDGIDGRLCPPRVHAFASAMNELSEVSGEMRAASRRRAEEYAWPKIAQRALVDLGLREND